jgi:hypothetical protein
MQRLEEADIINTKKYKIFNIWEMNRGLKEKSKSFNNKDGGKTSRKPKQIHITSI